MKTNLKIWLVMVALLSGMVGTAFGGKIIYVDADATGLNNGSNWANAYKYLQDGLASARSAPFKPVEIRVAQGIYKPDQGKRITPGDRMASFQLINGVTIKGGYAGFGEPDPNVRDVALYETILSGDIGRPSDKSDNCYHIFYHPEGLNLDATATLDGFMITGGNADGSSGLQASGSGMLNQDSSPKLTNCTFSYNSAIGYGEANVAEGGGMFNQNSSPKLTNCTFSYNSAIVYGGSSIARGGGMLNQNSSPKLTNCTFSYNSAIAYGEVSVAEGGGMLNQDSSPKLTNCTFSYNSSSVAYREVNFSQGGGMSNNWNSSPSVEGCSFIGNSAHHYGGGMYNYDNSSPKVEGCTFSGNAANEDGGGMYNYNSSPAITNCTFNGNSAGDGGGMHSERSNMNVTNCILWSDVPSEIYSDTPIVVTYSDVQGSWPGVGNINAEPLFVAPIGGNLHLQADSPCINAGDPNYVAGPNETDIDGELRVMFERIDMGADEFNPIRLGIVKKTRTGRTQFVYDCNATFTNLWPFAVKNVQLEMIKASDNMDINEPNVSFGDIEFSPRESITSIDTCTFQVDRSKAIEPDKIVWQVKCQRADTGMPLELTINGVSSSGLEGEGKIGFEDLAELAGQWLWVGPAGSIPEDVTGDGIVNLRDFAVLAEQRLEGK